MGVGARRVVGLAISTVAIVAGCVAARTPQVVYVTPEPPPPTPIVIYVTPSPTPTPRITLMAPSPTDSPTPTPAPTPTATSRAAKCTGTADNKAFFAEAATKVPWAVYCAILPKGWSLTHGEYTAGSSGKLMAVYQTKSGDEVGIEEGAFCTGGPANCGGMGGVDMGAASFGGQAGRLMKYGPMYAVLVNPGTTRAYAMIATGLTAAQAKSFAKTMYWVPRS